ncbi:MAG: threonine/serine dehydratase [Frankiaceae bacterium]
MGRDEIEAAAARLGSRVRMTPVVHVEPGGLGVAVPLALKLELLQVTGSFKPRGAFNRVLSAGVPAAGLVAASGGNHGLAVAHVASRLGERAEIFVPTSSSPVKVARLRTYGAHVVVTGDHYADAYLASRERAAATGALEVHAYDQPEVVAGQGTVGRELDHQLPGVDTVLVAVGGGGLLGGIATWFAGRARVVAVEPERIPSMAAALDAGHPVDVEVGGVAADSLGARRAGAIGLAAARAAGARSVLVPDAAIVEARQRLWDGLRIAAEAGGAAALAALTCGAYRPAAGEVVAVVICGGNTDPADLVRKA